MTTPTHDTIRAARTARLATEPFDPHKVALPAFDSANGLPSGFITFPNLGELSMLAMREGMDLLARLHDEDLVEEWIHDVLTLMHDPEKVGLFLVNVIRNLAPVLAARMRTDTDEGARELYRRFAFEAWSKDFTQPEGDTAA